MSTINLRITVSVILLIVLAGCGRKAKISEDIQLPVNVETILISDAGTEHFGNAVFRRGLNGPRIAASGSRILEWFPEANAAVTEVVPPGGGEFMNGACVIDVNGDNTDEMIAGRNAGDKGSDLVWFGEVAGQEKWAEHVISTLTDREGDAEKGFHDIMPFITSVQNTLIHGLAGCVSRKRVWLFIRPDDPSGKWKDVMVADLSQYSQGAPQSGLIAGSISAPGKQDLVCGNFWIECPDDPLSGKWLVHRYSTWDSRTIPQMPGVPEWVSRERFGGMDQLDLGDIDGDGNNDIVAAEAEIPGARLSVFFRNQDDPSGLWNEKLIDSGLYIPHSLVVRDVNMDDRPDIIVGEMTAGGWMFPRNAEPKLILYLNADGEEFRKYVLYKGKGIHMMRAETFPDGTLFLYAADEIQSWYPDMTTHVIGWKIKPVKMVPRM